MSTIDWLLDSDPALRWQVLRDLTDEPDHVVEAERKRVNSEGWGARLLSLQDPDGYWAGGAYFPADTSNLERGEDGRLVGQPWTATTWALSQLRWFGVDPADSAVREAVALVEANCKWEYAGEPFFEGEVEPCVNGVTVANGAYFGVGVSSIVDRLLEEQMDDGGWNCEQENGSKRGSFHTTIAVLEGLAEYERTQGATSELSAAQDHGNEYLLERSLFKRRSTGEAVEASWLEFSFPNWWHYDVLRGLDYFRQAGGPDPRMSEALDAVRSAKGGDDRWPRSKVWLGAIHFDVDGPEDEASRWITLKALRVLGWAG